MSLYGQFCDGLNLNFTAMILLEVVYVIKAEVIKRTFVSVAIPLTLLGLWK